MRKIKSLFSFAIFFIALISGILLTAPKALAYNGSVGVGIQHSGWNYSGTFVSYTIASPADAIKYRSADIKLSVGCGTTGALFLDDNAVVSFNPPDCPGWNVDKDYPEFDFSTIPGALENGTHSFKCGGWSPGTGSYQICTVAQPPACTSLTVSPSVIVIGESTTLSWVTVDAGSISFDPAITGPFNLPSGNISITPAAVGSYTYTMTANGIISNLSGSATCPPVTINVIPPPPPTCTLTADPNAIFSGSTDSVTLTWTSQNAASAKLDSVDVNLNDSKTISAVSPGASYNLAVSGPGGNASCSAVIGTITPPTGGLVPCGRLIDDPATAEIDESKPCDICSMFYMLKKTLNFAMQVSLALAILVIIISGLLYAFSAGDAGLVGKAKNAIYYALIGLAIMFAAWVIIASILKGLGYADITKWNQVDCELQKPPPIVVGSVDLDWGHNYIFIDAIFCFDESLGAFTPDTACVFKYGAGAKAGAKIFPTCPGCACNGVRSYCSGGDNCSWRRYECLK